VPDVRRHLSSFLEGLLMLLNTFNYLSDMRAPLIVDLGGTVLWWKTAYFAKIQKKIFQSPRFCATTIFCQRHQRLNIDLPSDLGGLQGPKHRFCAKAGMCGQTGQYAQHLSDLDFFRFLKIFKKPRLSGLLNWRA